MTVATIFGDTADAYIQSGNATYSTARSGGTLSVSGGFSVIAGQATGFNCWEAFIAFDTSSIGGSSTVSVVTLDLWLEVDNSATDFTMNARDRAWGPTVTTADYVAGASLSGSTLVASIASSGIGATGAYKTFTSQAAFLSITNIKTGTVEIILCSSRHEGNNQPTNNEYLQFTSADNTGTTQDPKLTVTYTVVSSLPPVQSKANRIWRRR